MVTEGTENKARWLMVRSDTYFYKWCFIVLVLPLMARTGSQRELFTMLLPLQTLKNIF